MKKGLRAIAFILNIAYPFIILIGSIHFGAPLRLFIYVLIGVVALNLIAYLDSIKSGDAGALLRIFGLSGIAAILIVLMLVTRNADYAKLYPVFVNVSLLLVFAGTLIKPPTIVWRLATLQDKALAENPDAARAEAYCRGVTIVWCCFFVLNASMALVTSLWASDKTWSLYNGLIAYVLMGTLFAVELLVRRRLRVGK